MEDIQYQLEARRAYFELLEIYRCYLSTVFLQKNPAWIKYMLEFCFY